MSLLLLTVVYYGFCVLASMAIETFRKLSRLDGETKHSGGPPSHGGSNNAFFIVSFIGRSYKR